MNQYCPELVNQITMNTKDTILKYKNLNLILIGEVGVGKTIFLNGLLGMKIYQTHKENNKTTEVMIVENKKYHIKIYDTPGFNIQDLNESKAIDLLNKMIEKCSKNTQNYAVLFFLKNDNIYYTVSTFLKQIIDNIFSYLFILSVEDETKINLNEAKRNLIDIIDGNKIIGITYFNTENKKGIDQICDKLINYFQSFQIQMNSKYITYQNIYIFDKKQFDKDEINLKILLLFRNLIFHLLSDLDLTISYNNILKNFSLLINYLSYFTITISFYYGEKISVKDSYKIIEANIKEIFDKGINNISLEISKNVHLINLICEQFEEYLNSFFKFHLNHILQNNTLVCISYCYMTRFYLNINREFEKCKFVFEKKDNAELAEAFFIDYDYYFINKQ